MTTTKNPSVVLATNIEQIELFVTKYLVDYGIGVQLIEVIAKELFNQQVDGNVVTTEDLASTPREMLSTAVQDLVKIPTFGGEIEFDIDRVVNGAASLDFIVRYARKVDPAVFPPEVIPSDEVVKAALELFNSGYRSQVTEGVVATS